MKQFTFYGSKNSFDIVHIRGDKPKYSNTNDGNITLSSEITNSTYILKNVDALVFNQSANVSYDNTLVIPDTTNLKYHAIFDFQDYDFFTNTGNPEIISLGNINGVHIDVNNFLQFQGDLHYNSFSTSFWLDYKAELGTDHSIIVNYENDYEIAVNNNEITWAIYKNNADATGWIWIGTGINMPTGVNHFVFQFNSDSGQCEIYINSVLQHTYNFTRSPNTGSSVLTLGSRSTTVGTSDQQSSSDLIIGDFALFDRYLTQEQVNLIYQRGLVGIKIGHI